MNCEWCGEPVTEGQLCRPVACVRENGIAEVGAYHHECLLRSIVGSVGHQLKRCSCFGGTFEDPPNMSRRESALAAVGTWQTLMRLRFAYETDDSFADQYREWKSHLN